MKKVLLVGGCGFIGHNLAIYLKKLNYDVRIVDGLNVNNLFSFSDDSNPLNKFYRSILSNRIQLINKNQIPMWTVDARDYYLISSVIDNFKPEVIIHLAAVSHANKSNKDPHSTFDHSLRTLENVLDASKKLKPHFIYFSSSMIYGNFNGRSVKEDDSTDPLGIYGSLKLSGELIVKAYKQVFDMPYTIIRPSALYGERCVSRRVGQIFIENAIRGLEIKINGNGSEKLDFTYIGDLVYGIKLCIENQNSKNQIFNITYGSGRKISDLIEILLKEYEDIKIVYEEKDKLTPDRGTLDTSKAKKLLNYQPKFPIDIGYKDYISWYKSFYQNILIK